MTLLLLPWDSKCDSKKGIRARFPNLRIRRLLKLERVLSHASLSPILGVISLDQESFLGEIPELSDCTMINVIDSNKFIF